MVDLYVLTEVGKQKVRQKFYQYNCAKIGQEADLHRMFDILPGLKARGNNRAVAPRRVDISQAAATLAVVWLLASMSVFCLGLPTRD